MAKPDDDDENLDTVPDVIYSAPPPKPPSLLDLIKGR